MKLDELLLTATQQGASDLHLSTGLSPMLRIDGDIQPLDAPICQSAQLRDSLESYLSTAQMQQLATQQSIDFSLSLPHIGRFRANVFQQSRGLAAVFRPIPPIIPTLDALTCPAIFPQWLQASQGLIVVTGATGSGKSTTLAALVNHLNQHHCKHILTLEDPIEFIHRPKKCLINQREIGRDAPSFADALRAGLREDPDIILVGEMRDLATIRLALTAAETGHLVLATLHTRSAAQTVNRIIDVFPSDEKSLVRTMLAESLNAVIAQTLVNKIGGGRTAVWEIMTATPAIKNLIREDKIAQMHTTIQTGRAAGMQTRDQHLNQLVQTGVISAATAREHSAEQPLF